MAGSESVKRTPVEWARLFLRGLAMGIAEIVPGVSGGTIAFITGIYAELVGTLGRLPERLVTNLRAGIPTLWRELNVNFLLCLGAGMVVAVLSMAHLVGYLIEHQPVLLWSFFLGLILASAVAVGRSVGRFTLNLGMALGAGAGVGYAITQGVQIDFPSTPVWIFLAGALAVSAWLLPGVSGSFILLILGLYETVLVSIKSLDWQFLLVFAAGCAIGLLTFARVLSAAFRRYEAAVLAVLTGFMLGSVGRLWPWQRTVSYRLDEEMRATALITEPISPAHYEALTGLDAQIPMVIVLMCAGAACVWLLERLR